MAYVRRFRRKKKRRWDKASKMARKEKSQQETTLKFNKDCGVKKTMVKNYSVLRRTIVMRMGNWF